MYEHRYYRQPRQHCLPPRYVRAHGRDVNEIAPSHMLVLGRVGQEDRRKDLASPSRDTPGQHDTYATEKEVGFVETIHGGQEVTHSQTG